MKIEINLKIILLFIIFILINKIDIYIIFLVFILLHELSHMIVGMIFGYKPKLLKLNPLGVSISFYNYNQNMKNDRYKRIITYLAGPLFNFFIIFILSFFYIDTVLKTKIIYTNILLGIFNLLPILPLDGGKILKEILSIFFSYRTVSNCILISTKFFLASATIIYSVAIFKIKNIAIFLLILYLWYLYFIEEKKENILIRAYNVIEKK